MRLPLTTLEVFNAIARHGSFRAAAMALGLKPSTVSHQLKALEDQIGTELFIRTTRTVNLTEAGRALYWGTHPAFEQLSEAFESARTTGHTARGQLRLAIPEFIYHMLVGPVLAEFCRKYPEIDIELSMTDAMSDIRQDEMHAGFRLGDRITESMVAVRLTPPLAMFVGASPQYLADHGIPQSPEALLHHSCIRYRYQTAGSFSEWQFQGDDGSYTIDVSGQLTVNTLPAWVDLAKQGLGFIYTFRAYCAAELASGALVSVLDAHLGELPGIYIYFPREYRSMLPLRLLLDHLRASSTLA